MGLVKRSVIDLIRELVCLYIYDFNQSDEGFRD